MKTYNEDLKNNILALAVQSALLAMFIMPVVAKAEDASVNEDAALTHPTNMIEVGATGVFDSSSKFGEYNGLDESRLYGLANIDVRGGEGYNQGDDTTRWQIKGSDLGTTSRSVGASVSDQGQWNIGINFDELRHNLTDSYQTPYLGGMGGNNFVLPTGFGLAPSTIALNPTQKSALHTEDIHTTRENTSLTAGYNLTSQWDIKFDFNHLNQTGAKLMAFGAAGRGGASGEFVSILPNPTKYTTDTVNLALNWAGEKSHVNASYFGSYFRNDYDRVTFQTFAGANTTQTMSTAPDNDFHQFNLTGGYSISPKTKLSGGVSYGHNTQNDAFAYDSNMMITASPRTSLDGKVITTHADLKLTDQTIKNLTFSAGFKYDERDNKTQSSIYNFYAIDGNIANVANYPNTPLSNRKSQFELAGDYRINNKQHMRLAYNRENVQRWCGQYAVNAGYPAGTNCVVATDSRDDKLSASYRINPTEDVKLNVGYSYSDRRTDSDPNARAAFISVRGGDVGATVGTIKGLNAGDYLGFYPYFDATRRQQMVKAGADWQANDKLSLGLNGKYTDDNYYDSTYGVQDGNSWSLNLDATYSYSENSSVSAYITKESRQRDMTNLQRSVAQGLSAANVANTSIAIPAGATWSNKLNDDDITFGLGAKKNGLIGGKLNLAGDLTYSLGKTGYGTQLNYATTTLNGLSTCSSAIILSCGQLPDIKNKLIQFKLSGDYKVNKNGEIGVAYIYQHLISNDYFYNGYQYGFTPTQVMPTNQQSGSYSVNTLAASYTYTFQ